MLSEEAEEEKGAYRVSVTLSKKDVEWMQKQVDEGEYTSMAEVVRECVRTVRTGGRREGIRIPVGPIPSQVITIPTEVAMEQPSVVSDIMERLDQISTTTFPLKQQKKEEKKESQ